MSVLAPEKIIGGRQSYQSLTNLIANVVLQQRRHPLSWYLVFGFAFTLFNLLQVAVIYLLYRGVGIWGINQPIGWGFAIINFVWWIGIGHAGTLISAILLLMRQGWRTSINRFAEAMTLFAVACAGLFPLIHTGRPWVAYWLMPIGPNILDQWPQFRSPLVWDVFAVSTYATVSAIFWFTGLIPDLATMRDKATNRYAKYTFGVLAMGWRGAASHWLTYETAYLILGSLSAPLVLSVHTIVSFDFAVSLIPGWHTTIFPPYFVAGAIYAGFAMVLLLAIPVRAMYGLKDLITMRHIDWMCKFTLATGMVVFYGYMCEIFYGWWGGNHYEWYMIYNRFTGPYWPMYWCLLICNGLVPHVFWSKRVRQNIPAIFITCLIVSIGMWLERFVIISLSLTRDFLPSSWGVYTGTVWDWATYIGTFGLFLTLMFLFIRFVPMIAIAEMKDLLHRTKVHDMEAMPPPIHTTLDEGAVVD